MFPTINKKETGVKDFDLSLLDFTSTGISSSDVLTKK